MNARNEGPHGGSVASPVIFHNAELVGSAARRVVSDHNAFLPHNGFERSARNTERERLARELHDGVLQSLTSAALQLHALSSAHDRCPERVMRNRLAELEALICEQQRELRGWIETLKPPAPAATASHKDMESALRALCTNVAHCGVHVELSVPIAGSIPRRLGDQVYRLVQEGLSNAVRHARAKNIRVELFLRDDRVELVIGDDGRGFPFMGAFDLRSLNERGVGPVSIKERVASNRGGLRLTSTPAGARLTITLPRDAHASR